MRPITLSRLAPRAVALALLTIPLAGAQTIPLERADVNGDCVVTKADASIVQSLLGRKAGKPGFNPAADVNRDGVINNVDVTFVARNIGKTVCSANRPPVITSTAVTAALRLGSYSYTVVATDADHDAITFTLPTAPLGMTIHPATGVISWTPPGTGTLSVVVRADDGHGGVATQAFAVVVGLPANRPPHMAAIPDRQIPLGVPFRVGMTADDPDPGDALTFEVLSGPAGASLSPSPVFAWTPGLGQVGLHQVAVKVRDAAGASDSTTFTLEVVASNAPPVLGAMADVTIPAGAPYSRLVTAVDPNPGDVITYTLAGGPSGLAVSAGGALSWTPDASQLGGHAITLSATDSGGLSDATTFTINVDVPSPSQPPVAMDDRYAVRRQSTLEVAAPGVLANDTDPAGRPLMAQLVTAPTKGALTLAANGALSYALPPIAPGSTAPALAYTSSYSDGGGTLVATYSQPLVADLEGDGEAEIVFLALGAFGDRRLVAVHGGDGSRAFAVNAYQPAAAPPIALCFSFCELAAADLDGDGRVEILAVHSDDETSKLRRKIVAFNYDGTYRWTSDDILDGVNVTQTTGMTWINVADLDGDGSPEIVVLHEGKTPVTPAGVIAEDLVTVFDRHGHIQWTRRVPGKASNGKLVIADLNLDGTPDIAMGGAVLDHAGTIIWNIKASPSYIPVGYLSVANLDDDPFPEIVYTDQFGNLSRHEHTGSRTWGPIRQPLLSGFGAPTIADVDGDGLPEIVRGADGVEVWDRSGHLVRTMLLPAPHLGWGHNATVFDLNGDGRPEVIYNGAHSPLDTGSVRGALYIFDGPTGELLHTMAASRNSGGSGVGIAHVPIVADVNGDGSAEIVTGGWNETTILRVFKAAVGAWATTRPIWNQMDYHVTNVESDGRIPTHELVNWLTPGLNNFRANVPLPGERTSDVDEFTYVASNGLLGSNVATVRIDILPPNTAPRILSSAPAAAAGGLEYVYGVRAVDPDIGESLTFSLVQAPAGMTIEAGTGVVRWTPAANATGSVMPVVRVTDSQDETDSQAFTITIGAPAVVPDVVGQSLVAAQALLASDGFDPSAAVSSPNATIPAGLVISQEPLGGALVAAGARVSLVVSSGPSAVSVPYLVTMTEEVALRRLDTLGLGTVVTRAFSNTVPRGRVMAQNPAAGVLLVPGAVSVTVSAGTGLTLRLAHDIASAGESITFVAAAYDLTYAEIPAPALTFSMAPALIPVFGSLPTVAGHTIATAATTRGAFRLTATDPGTGRAVATDFAVTFPRTPGVASQTDVYAGLSAALNDIDGLAQQARTALALGDTASIRSLLDQMVTRWRQVDTGQLRLTTPFGLPEGFFPAPSEVASLGLVPTADDLVAQHVLKDAIDDLRALIDGVREPSTSMATLEALADRFNTRAARLESLTLSEWGAIKGAPAMTTIVSSLLPAFYDALTDDLATVVERSASGPGPSTLAEQLTIIAVKYVIEKVSETPLHKYKEAVLKQAAWSTSIVAAAHHFKARIQGGNLEGIVAGASLAIHVFKAPWSFIEGNVDTDQPGNTTVFTLGPDQLSFLQQPLGDIKGAVAAAGNAGMLFVALNRVYQWLKEGEASAPIWAGLVKKSFQPTGEGYKGCVFSSAPACGQLVFGDGFEPVYEYSPPDEFEAHGFTGLPVPILFLVYDKSTGTVTVDTPVFLPFPK